MKLANIAIGIDSRPAKHGAGEVKDALHGVSKEANKTGKEVDKLEEDLKQLEKGAVNSSKELKDLSISEDKAAKAALGLAKKIGALVGGISAMYLIVSTVKDLKDFERGLIGVGKTADLTDDQLDVMADSVIRMTLDAGKLSDEFLEVAATAGQLGVKGTQNILNFTDAIVKLGGATGGSLQGEEAATALARILNVTGDGTGKILELSNVIVALGNNLAATEGEIAHTATSVALSTAAFDVSSSEAAALGGALAALGVRAELSGSAIGRTMRMIDDATRSGGQSLKVLEQLVGGNVREMFAESQVKTLYAFIQGLGQFSKEGGNVAEALENLGLSGEEILKVLPTLAVNSELVGDALSLMNEQLENGTALANENSRASDSLGTEIDRIGAVWRAAKLELRNHNGTLQETAKLFADTGVVLLGYAEGTDASRLSTELLAFSLKALAVPATYLALTSLASGVKALSSALSLAAVKQYLLNTAVKANPYVLAASAIASVATAFFLFSTNAEQAIDSAERMNNSLARLSSTADGMTDLDIILSRAFKLGDEDKQIQTYTRMLSQLEQAYVQVKKESVGVRAGDLADILGLKNEAPIIDMEKMKGVSEIYYKQIIIDSDKAASLIEKRIKEIQKTIDEKRPKVGKLDFGEGSDSKFLKTFLDGYDKILSSAVAKNKSLIDSTTRTIQTIDLEREYMSLGNDERAITIQALQLEMDLRASGSTQAKELANAYYESAMALLNEKNASELARAEMKEFDDMQQQIINSRVQARATIADMQTSLRLETLALSMSNSERERMNAILQYGAALRASGSKNVLEETEAYEEQLIVLQNQQAWHSVAANISGSVGNAITDLALNLTDFESAVEQVGSTVQRALFEKLVTEPLVEAMTTKLATALPDIFGSLASETGSATVSATILKEAGITLGSSMVAGANTAGGLLVTYAEQAAAILATAGASAGIVGAGASTAPALSANGNAFDISGIIPMANGGLITGPTLFPMANNKNVLGGEAGTEAIMPLKRGADGKLGVIAQGGATNNKTTIIKVYTPNADSFRSSQRQIADAQRRAR